MASTSTSRGDARYAGFLPLKGPPSIKKVSESESSTASGQTYSTSDDGEMESMNQSDSLKLQSIVGGVTVDTSRGMLNSMCDSLDRSSGELRCEEFDPFECIPSSTVMCDDVDLDQLDAGDMFPDDSEDLATDEMEASMQASSLLPQLDADSDIEQDSTDVLIKYPANTKGVEILNSNRKPQSVNDYFSGTHVASSVSLAGSSTLTPNNGELSFVDGSARPALYSAIGSLEEASANSLGKLRSQRMASCARPFDRDPGLLIPPARDRSTTSQSATPVSNHKRSVKVVINTRCDSDDNDPRYSKLPSKTTRIRQESDAKGALKERADSYEPLAGARYREDTVAGLESSVRLPGSMKINKPNQPRRKPKKVTIKESTKPKEIFRPSSDAYTPRVAKKHFKFKPAELRTPVQSSDQDMGTLSRPNFRDALKRVAMIIKQHIVKIEQRLDGRLGRASSDGLFRHSMLEAFTEENFATPRYRCTMVRLPMAHPGMVYGLVKVQPKYEIPTEEEIYEFGHQLFKSVQLSSECSIVCLIYIERLMEVAMVPLVSRTWRTVFMCGLLLASKVWQDLSSWNIEFASVYPQFSLEAINRLEVQFLKMIKWDLYISSSLYAKYYFALRSILEKQDFRMRYNRMVGGVGNVNATEALKIQKRSEMAKEEALLQMSRSM